LEDNMKIRMNSAVALCAAAAAVVSTSTANAGLVWERSSNWVPGVGQGSTVNNPSLVNGVPVWQYETTQGGGLSSANPWYKSAGQLMTWDTAWWATGWGVWAKGDDFSPPVLAGRTIHNVHPTTWDDVPVVRWLNPVGNTSVDLTGTLTVNWNGVNGLGRPVNVDVVIAKYTAATNQTTLLYSETVAKPNPFPSVGDSVFLPVNLANVPMAAGDSLIFSHRGQNAVGPLGAWVNLYDAITISAIPAPSALGVLALAGIAATRRRRT
jgi:hypothetical protein